MRRKPGALVPLEMSILAAAARLLTAGTPEFHGYEMAKHLAGGGARRLLTAYGTLYRALGRMEQMSLLESRWEDPQIAARENRPGRRLYRLTADGAALAREQRLAGAARTAKAPGKVRHARQKIAPA